MLRNVPDVEFEVSATVAIWVLDIRYWVCARLANEEAQMIPFSECPICGGEVVEKEMEKLLRGGNNTAVLTVRAEVCLRCGERSYSTETVQRFEQIRAKLARQEVDEFEPLGQFLQVVN